jgi:glycosyltransferase involved in cell wall biosynthesis
MRVLFVLHQFFPEFSSGTEQVALNLARMLQRAGHSVHVLACTVQPEKTAGVPESGKNPGWRQTVYRGVPVTFVPRSEMPAAADVGLDSNPEVVDRLAAWVSGHRFDVAHVFHTMRMGGAVVALQRCGVPYVMTLTDFFLPCGQINLVNLSNRPCPGPDEGRRCARDCPTAPWTPAGYAARYQSARSVLEGAAERVAPSSYVAARFKDSFPSLDFRVVEHGIDLLALAAAMPAAGQGKESRVLQLAYVGTIIPQKGLDVLLKALAQVPAANLKLKVIGGFFGNSGYHDQIRALAAADARVELQGRMESAAVFAALSQADLLCLPSKVPESFSLVLREACAVGVPALVTDLGAPAGLVSQHGCGRVLPAGNVAAWAAALVEITENPETLREWKLKLPLPMRVEEEAFLYESLYRRFAIKVAQ